MMNRAIQHAESHSDAPIQSASASKQSGSQQLAAIGQRLKLAGEYRYWKSDEATKMGQYSEQFLSTLSPEQRKQFTQR